MVGLAKLGEPLPYIVNQRDLADALGLSLVHTNKTLAVLKNKKLFRFVKSRMEILNWAGLVEVASFDPAYLHLREPDALRVPPKATD